MVKLHDSMVTIFVSVWYNGQTRDAYVKPQNGYSYHHESF